MIVVVLAVYNEVWYPSRQLEGKTGSMKVQNNVFIVALSHTHTHTHTDLIFNSDFKSKMYKSSKTHIIVMGIEVFCSELQGQAS
jgi:hypothetical protein